jgi:hypothetical protein
LAFETALLFCCLVVFKPTDAWLKLFKKDCEDWQARIVQR